MDTFGPGSLSFIWSAVGVVLYIVSQMAGERGLTLGLESGSDKRERIGGKLPTGTGDCATGKRD